MRTEICNVMEEAYKRNWITTRDGNISYRLKDKFYITPSGMRKNVIRAEDIMKGFFSGNLKKDLIMKESNSKPSGEFEMHLLLQQDPAPCRAVVHLHPTNTIAAMYKGWDLQYLAEQFPELSRYTQVGPTVEVHPVCSPGLAKDTAEAFESALYEAHGLSRYDIVGQKQHGVTAIAKDPWAAFEHIERLEHICTIALNSGVNPND